MAVCSGTLQSVLTLVKHHNKQSVLAAVSDLPGLSATAIGSDLNFVLKKYIQETENYIPKVDAADFFYSGKENKLLSLLQSKMFSPVVGSPTLDDFIEPHLLKIENRGTTYTLQFQLLGSFLKILPVLEKVNLSLLGVLFSDVRKSSQMQFNCSFVLFKTQLK